MARDRRSHVRKKGEPHAAGLPADMGAGTSHVTSKPQSDHRDKLIALIRALARDAARADHEREQNARLDDKKPPR
jgi:hypothetical protein